MAQDTQDEAPTPGQDDGAESNGDFAAAFAERATDQTADSREAPADDDASANDPAEQAGSEQPPADAGGGDTGSESNAPAFDPFAGMTPEQVAFVTKLQSSERSQRGRVGALTKKLNTFSERPAAAAPTDGSEQAPAKDGKEATASDLEARLAAVAEEYGDVNGPLVEAIKGLQSKIETLEASPQRDDAPVSEADVEAMTQAYDTLAGNHPDYEQVATSTEFLNWLGAKPASVQALVNSFDPGEVSLGLSLYKAEAGLAGAAGGQSGEPGRTATSDKRQRQLEGSRDTRSRGAPAAAGVPNDFSTAFKARVAAQA